MAAIKVADRLGKGSTVATIIVDSGFRLHRAPPCIAPYNNSGVKKIMKKFFHIITDVFFHYRLPFQHSLPHLLQRHNTERFVPRLFSHRGWCFFHQPHESEFAFFYHQRIEIKDQWPVRDSRGDKSRGNPGLPFYCSLPHLLQRNYTKRFVPHAFKKIFIAFNLCLYSRHFSP